MYQIWVVGGITLIAGLIGGWAGYLLDPVSDDANAQLRSHTRTRYLLLGLIAAACVPLFLSLLQSGLLANIFSPKKENNVEIVPFSEFLIFTGFCLVAALSSRTFLDTISRQLMRDVQRANKKAAEAEAKANEAGERAAVASDLVDETLEKDSAQTRPAMLEAAKQLPAEVIIPEISPEERKALNALMKMSFRTATGIGRDIGIPRSQVGELLDALASKELVERTTSPNTGGPRWRITPLGVRTLEAK